MVKILQNQQQMHDEPQEVNHSQPDLDFNIKLDDEKKMQQQAQSGTSLDAPTVIIPPVIPQEVKKGHPMFIVQMIHCLFKGLAVAFFFLLNTFIDNSTITFVLIVLLFAFDFWTVKNITGRKLVGLRWWSEFLDDGTEVWKYESMDANFQADECNSSVFWFAQLAAVITWSLLSLMDLIGLRWFWGLLAITGLILSSLNLIGFYKCRGAHQKKAKDYMSKIGLKAIQRAM